MKYNYREAIVKDIKNYIIDNYMAPEPGMTRDEYEELLDDELWGVAEITGNSNYGYYADEETCAEYVGHGLLELVNSLEEWGFEVTKDMKNAFKQSPACYCDCIIRTHLLFECIGIAIDELGYKFEVN